MVPKRLLNLFTTIGGFLVKTLLVTNIKGGVAKSSTAVAIATGLKLLKPESKVLLIDGDPQGSIKTYFGLKLQNSDKDFSSFLVEDTLKEKGGQYSKAEDWQVHVQQDGLLITGQNPASSAATAEALLKLLK